MATKMGRNDLETILAILYNMKAKNIFKNYLKRLNVNLKNCKKKHIPLPI